MVNVHGQWYTVKMLPRDFGSQYVAVGHTVQSAQAEEDADKEIDKIIRKTVDPAGALVDTRGETAWELVSHNEAAMDQILAVQKKARNTRHFKAWMLLLPEEWQGGKVRRVPCGHACSCAIAVACALWRFDSDLGLSHIGAAWLMNAMPTRHQVRSFNNCYFHSRRLLPSAMSGTAHGLSHRRVSSTSPEEFLFKHLQAQLWCYAGRPPRPTVHARHVWHK